MGRNSGRLREKIKHKCLEAGAVAVGFAVAGDISEEEARNFKSWLDDKKHAGMSYLERHETLRKNPESVLPGVKTVISLAFSYNVGNKKRDPNKAIASYAYGKDYHKVIRDRLNPVIESLKKEAGGEWRVCVDSAPVAERYWALKSGIGIRGRNGAIIINGAGSFCFLAEILTTIPIEPDKNSPQDISCIDCNLCVRECPTGALSATVGLDARKCINYLTIEHRGEWAETGKKIIEKGSFLFGCERCLDACPYNENAPLSPMEEFLEDYTLKRFNLEAKNKEELTSISDEKEFRQFFKNSAISRLKYDDFIRNLRGFKFKTGSADLAGGWEHDSGIK